MFRPYEPHPLRFLGVETIRDYQIKVYALRRADQKFDRQRFADGEQLAAATLPQPAILDDERPGVGFLLLHQAGSMDYLILCRWDRQNELPTHVFVADDTGWRPAADQESFCVWDLRVIWWEREAYVATVLAEQADGVDQYLTWVVRGYA